jgi:predicted lysophospholipase L1 biosynthesis ABC-type transport system permease subunit
MVNLDVAQRGSPVASGNVITLWFADDDPAMLARVTAALRAAGVAVASTSTLAQAEEGYDESLPAWSLQLASVVGLVGLAIAALVLLVIAVATWRLRSRDLATLRMAGLGSGSLRRIAVTEPLLAIGLAIVAGAACGVVGAHFSLPTVPLLPITPEVSTTDLSTAWLAVGTATAVAAVALAVIGWLVGRTIAQRATLQRIRETL